MNTTIAKASLAMALMCAAPSAAWAQIYKWVDDHGVTHFSEHPAEGSVKSVLVQPAPETSPRASVTGSVEATGATWQEKETAFKQRQIKREDAQRKQDEAEASAKAAAAAAQERCQAARRQIHAVDTGIPIYRINDQGDRDFLTEPERAASRQRAEAQTRASCG